MKSFALFLTFTLLSLQSILADAHPLAAKVMQESGAKEWKNVQEIEFTFRVVIDGAEKVSAHHVWNVAANTDMVSWGDKKVTVDLSKTPVSEDEKAAFQRWTNDTYWLVAPLKLLDPGTQLSPAEIVEIDGRKLEAFDLSFQQVGLTPGDKYRYYIDSTTSLPVAWDYQPNATTKKRATWDKYQKTGGLNLSTHHVMGNVEIWIDNLEVKSKP